MKVSNKLLTMINLITQIFIWQNLRVLQRNNIAELLFCTNFHRSGHKIWSLAVDYTDHSINDVIKIRYPIRTPGTRIRSLVRVRNHPWQFWL